MICGLPMFASVDADSDTVSTEVRHKESHSMHLEHQGGTSGCSLGTSMEISSLLVIGFASYIWRDDHLF